MSVENPKTMIPPADKALVYVVRPDILGALIKFKVFVNDELIGSTKGRNYIYKILEPGEYTVMSKAENKSEVKTTLEAGKAYYFKQEIEIGFIKSRNLLRQLDEEKGKQALQKCNIGKLIK